MHIIHGMILITRYNINKMEQLFNMTLIQCLPLNLHNYEMLHTININKHICHCHWIEIFNYK